MKPAKIRIGAFEITSFRLPEVGFRITCSKGTYIRSIARDLGDLLGTGGYLSALCRTRIGMYYLADAITPEQFIQQLAEN